MALTWARIAFIPLIVGVFYVPDALVSPHMKNVLACIMFIIAAITDALDGYIARNYNMATMMGAFLDSVADKLVVCSAIVVLLAFDRVDMIVALIIVGREIAVTALREWMAKIGAAANAFLCMIMIGESIDLSMTLKKFLIVARIVALRIIPCIALAWFAYHYIPADDEVRKALVLTCLAPMPAMSLIYTASLGLDLAMAANLSSVCVAVSIASMSVALMIM